MLFVKKKKLSLETGSFVLIFWLSSSKRKLSKVSEVYREDRLQSYFTDLLLRNKYIRHLVKPILHRGDILVRFCDFL